MSNATLDQITNVSGASMHSVMNASTTNTFDGVSAGDNELDKRPDRDFFDCIMAPGHRSEEWIDGFECMQTSILFLYRQEPDLPEWVVDIFRMVVDCEDFNIMLFHFLYVILACPAVASMFHELSFDREKFTWFLDHLVFLFTNFFNGLSSNGSACETSRDYVICSVHMFGVKARQDWNTYAQQRM
jgi:hypothetical protein